MSCAQFCSDSSLLFKLKVSCIVCIFLYIFVPMLACLSKYKCMNTESAAAASEPFEQRSVCMCMQSHSGFLLGLGMNNAWSRQRFENLFLSQCQL